MRIITVSRQFGSGGRALAKRISELLDVKYYDAQIIRTIAERMDMDEDYVAYNLEDVMVPTIPLTYGQTLYMTPEMTQGPKLIGMQDRVIKELADQGDCVIVGRGADVILEDAKPFRIYVYAEMAARVARCQARNTSETHLSDREMEKEIVRIDRRRARTYEFVSAAEWGDLENADLCINTTHIDLELAAEGAARMAAAWFAARDERTT